MGRIRTKKSHYLLGVVVISAFRKLGQEDSRKTSLSYTVRLSQKQQNQRNYSISLLGLTCIFLCVTFVIPDCKVRD